MGLIWSAAVVIMSAIDISFLFLFSEKMIGINDKYKWYQVAIGVIIATAVMATSTFIHIYSIWKVFLSILIFVVLSIIFFQGTQKQKIFNVIFYSIILSLSDILGTVIILFFADKNISLQELIFLGENKLTAYGIARIITILLITLLSTFSDKEEKYLPSKYWYSFLILFAVILSAIFLIIDLKVSLEHNEFFDDIIMLILFPLLIFYITIYYLYHQLCKSFAKEKEISILEYQNEAIEKYLIQLNQSQKMIKILSHDLKHNLTNWKELACDNGYQEALKNIIEYEQIFESHKLVDVENDIANAVINQKMLIAKNNNISFHIQGVFFEDLLITKIDLCSLLGNMLDNAIEATIKIENCIARKIDFKIKRKDHFLLLELMNSYVDEPIYHRGMLQTSKKNRSNSGIGMISINHIVSKYDGILKMEHNDNVFKISLLLKAYEIATIMN